MARKLPDHHRHAGSIRYRCGIIERQLEALRLALIGFTTSGQDREAAQCLQAIRDQLDLLEASMPEIARDQVLWRAECDSRPGPGPDPGDEMAVP